MYISPEVFHRWVLERSSSTDLWALGVMLIELALGTNSLGTVPLGLEATEDSLRQRVGLLASQVAAIDQNIAHLVTSCLVL